MKEIVADSLRWIDIENPSKRDIENLQKEFSFHPLSLEDTLTPTQRPKIDEFEDHLYLVFHFPVIVNGGKKIASSELDIFVGKNYLVTIHGGNLEPLNDYFDQLVDDKRLREEEFKKSVGYILYSILNRLIDNCFPILGKVDEELESIEDEIFEGEEFSRLVRDISLVRRTILNYRKVIKPQRWVIRELEDRYKKIDLPKLEVYFGDLVDHIEKIWDILEDQTDVVERLNDTNLALVNTHTNDIIRVLTVLSVIFLPLTLVASVYGMNVVLPFGTHQFAFAIVLAFMVLVMASMLFFFRKKGWI